MRKECTAGQCQSWSLFKLEYRVCSNGDAAISAVAKQTVKPRTREDAENENAEEEGERDEVDESLCPANTHSGPLPLGFLNLLSALVFPSSALYGLLLVPATEQQVHRRDSLCITACLQTLPPFYGQSA